MKLPKKLLGAILIGVTIQITACDKEDETKPTEKEQTEEQKYLGNCPACGMG